MVFLKHLLVSTFFILTMGYSYGQTLDCNLDIGGKASDTVSVIFQLNEAQKQQMEDLRAKYTLTSKEIDEEIEKLFTEHPQSKPEELMTLAEKYRGLQAKLMNASRAIDEELLKTFNQRQYDFYLKLCKEAFREPIEVIPSNYETKVEEEK